MTSPLRGFNDRALRAHDFDLFPPGGEGVVRHAPQAR
jgi:hypothetical protein